MTMTITQKQKLQNAIKNVKTFGDMNKIVSSMDGKDLLKITNALAIVNNFFGLDAQSKCFLKRMASELSDRIRRVE